MKYKISALYLALQLFYLVSFSQLPIAGTWQVLGNEPDSRLENAYVHIGDKLFYFGGLENKPSYFFDPASNSWEKDDEGMPLNLHHLQAVSHEGLVYIASSWTGFNFAPSAISHIYIYNPIASPGNRWLKGPEIPGSRRRGGAGVAMYDGKIYIAGGVNGGHGGPADSKAWFDVYDPQTGSWEQLPDLPRVRDHYHGAVIGDKFYAAGGRDTGNPGYINDTYSEIDVYDFALGTWSTMTVELPQGRGGTMTIALDSLLMIFGGETGQALAHKEVDLVDVNNETWNAMSQMPVGRHGTQAIKIGNRIYLGGGSSLNGIGTNILKQEMLELSIDDPWQDHLIPVEAGILQSSAESIHFGFAQPGDNLEESVVLTHTGGNQGIIIDEIKLVGNGAFKLDLPYRFPIILGVGNDLTLDILLQPQSAGAKTAEIQIKHRGGNTILPISLESTDDSTYNHGPKLDIIPNQASMVGDTLMLQVSATDRDMDGLIFSANNLPAGLSINPQSGLISGIIGLPAGVFETTIYVEDQDLFSKKDSTTLSWSVTIPPNRPPYLRPLGVQTYSQGDTIMLQLSATDPDQDVLTFSTSSLPDSLLLDPQTGLISGIISADTGTYTIQAIATDDAIVPLSDTITITMVVNPPPPNQPPIFYDITDTTSLQGAYVERYTLAWDPEGDSITYAAFGLPPGLFMSARTGRIYGTIFQSAKVRNYAIIVQAWDNGTPMSAAGARAFNWAVLPPADTLPDNPSQLPVIQPISNQEVEQGGSVNLFLEVETFDLTRPQFIVTGLPQGLIFEPISGRIRGTVEADTGCYPVIVYALSGFPVKRGERAFNFVVTPPPNRAPVIVTPGNQANYQGDTIQLQLGATDPDGDSLKYYARGLDVLGLQVDSLSGIISGIIAADTGQYQVIFDVVDNGSPVESSSLLIRWRVDFLPNIAPVLDSLPDQQNEQWSIIDLQILASDLEGDTLIYSATGLPNGLAIDSLTGLISGAISDTVGVYGVSIQVMDVRPNALSDMITFNWEVIPATAILYRVNAGGIALNDSILGWDADKEDAPSPYFASTQSNNTTGWDAFGGPNTTAVPNVLFGTNRWDGPWGDEMIWSFPVDQGVYEARLYFAETKADIAVGDRVFDVLVEGEMALENFDIAAEVGTNTALEKAIQTSVTDGFLDIEFIRGDGTHPQINGIEIRRPGIQEVQRQAANGFSSQSLSTIKVYPNPTTGELNIELPATASREASTVNIYDMQGKLVKMLNFQAEPGIVLPLHNLQLEKGLYLVIVRQANIQYQPVRLVKW